MSVLLKSERAVRLVVVDVDQTQIDRVVRMAGESDQLRVTGMARTGQEGLRRILDLSPDVALVGHALPDQSGLELAEQIAKQAPSVLVVLITDLVSAELVVRAQAQGVRAVLQAPFSQKDLEACLVPLVESARRQWESLRERWPQAPVSSLASRQNSQSASAGAPVTVIQPEVVAVYHPKGGVGKTTVATNLAVGISSNRLARVRTALLDFDVNFGSVSTALGLGQDVSRTVLDWSYLDELPKTPEEADDLMVQHRSGVYVLPAPRHPRDESAVTGALAERVLATVRRFYTTVLVDCSPNLRDSTIVALQAATRVLIISTADVQAIERLIKFKGILDALGIPSDRIWFCLNRVQGKPALPVAEIAKTLDWPVLDILPEEPGLITALNRGELWITTSPDSPFGRSVRRIAHHICPVFPEAVGVPGPKTGWFARLRGGRVRT